MSKVLVYAECWGRGGIEAYLMNVFRLLSPRGFEFTLFTTWDCNTAFDSELSDLSIERRVVFHDACPSQIKRITAGTAAFENLLRLHRYDCVYVNTMNGLGFLYSQIAKNKNVPVRVVHSHNSQLGPGGGLLKRIVHIIGRGLFGSSATCRVACSTEAGNHLYGCHEFEVVNNGIDIERFAFSIQARRSLREKLGFGSDSIVIGSIGRIAPAKDPIRQLRIFEEVLRVEPNSYYLMVGEGELLRKAKDYADEIGIGDRVRFTGYICDTAPYYSVLDVFLMPSLFEGLPLACVEAQCSGCPVIASDTLPLEANITKLLTTVSCSANDRAWALAALSSVGDLGKRSEYSAQVSVAGFSLNELGNRLCHALSS